MQIVHILITHCTVSLYKDSAERILRAAKNLPILSEARHVKDMAGENRTCQLETLVLNVDELLFNLLG